ncbi:MAG: imidazolonepropionase [Rhodothermales bacterium]|nr:imidazolonepropionase [Rhodothermales bacterium]MBO6778418.1 imidazolonepropionase [Rhodothermales bacterium]
MPVLTNIGVLARCSPAGGQHELHLVRDAALAWKDGEITWVGSAAHAPGDEEVHDAGGRLVVPGLVDCHTHLAFGGWRADEFAQKCRGASYLEILESGGGIRNTMRQTRAASEEALRGRAAGFLKEMARLGVTTVEAKSGYGLSLEHELKQLRVYRELGVEPTFLGAHVVPPEFADADAYIDHLIVALPQVAPLARFCDVFVEEGAFSVEQARRLLTAASAYGMRAKLHVDQLGDGGGAVLAAEVGAISADHLEYTSEQGMRAMAAAGVVAVTLPIASLYLRQKPMDGRAFLDAGCSVAVATDFNPGSAPSYHLPFAMTLACTMNRLTPAEALKGATLIAARALDLETSRGSLDPGKRADFVLINAESVEQWLYHFVPNAAHQTFVAGEPVFDA